MPGFLVHVSAQVFCAHLGQAQPNGANARVTVGGQPTVLLTTSYTVTKCTLPPPPSANGPCASGQWLTGTTRVTSGGKPLVVNTGASICAPSGTPLIVLLTQIRVTAI